MTTTLRRATVCGAVLLFALGCDSSGPPAPFLLSISAGDGQRDTVGQTLPLPYALLVRNASDSTPAATMTVSWSVIAGGGSVTTTSTTGLTGVAIATRTLGTVAGPQKVRAGIGATAVTFTDTALAGPPGTALKVAGEGQNGAPGLALPVPFAVLVQDQYDNPVGGVTVSWAVDSGGGTLSPTSSQTAVGTRIDS